MIELEDGFSENDKYLIREYEKHGSDDFLLVDLGEKTYVVPYKYTIGSNSVKTSQQRFLTALLDFEDMEIGKYHRAGETVMSVEYEGRDYVIPFDRKGKFSPQDLARELHQKADTKYNAIINAARTLEDKGKPIDMLDFSSFAADKYAKTLADMNSTILLDEKTPEKLDILNFLDTADDKKLKTFHTSKKKISKSIGQKIVEAEHNASKSFVPRYYKVSALAALVGLSTTVGFVSSKQNSDEANDAKKEHVVNMVPEDDDWIEDIDPDVEYFITEDEAQTNSNETKNSDNPKPAPEVKHKKSPNSSDAYFVNFMGKKHSDTYGNIQLMQDLKPEISALLISVEGFAHGAFRDGGGTPTIGAGTTFYLSEKGKETNVQMGDKTSTWRGMLHKWRYINKYMIKYLGDDFGRSCSPREAMAGVGAGFCWGPSAFATSEFLKSMKNNESLDLQLRKLSGFRKQKGLLKRSYVLACCLSGVWTPKDLLDLPVYKIANKGFVHCSIYTLDLHEILPCRKDANGKFLKDEDGNDIPQVAKDGFCFDFYLDKAQAIRQKLIDDAQKGKAEYRTVRQLLPPDMVKSIENTKYDRTVLPYAQIKSTFAAMAKKLQNSKN